jgi:hypothetical protein
LLFNLSLSHLFTAPRAIHLLDTLINIAHLPYESRQSAGNILFASSTDPSVDALLKFSVPIALGEERRIRKLLEITSGDCFLHCDSYNIHGLCRHIDGAATLPIVATLEGHGNLRISEFGKPPLMVIENGKPISKSSALDFQTLSTWLRRVCPKVTEAAVRIVSETAAGAARKGHGAAIVICEDASDEVNRLKNTCFAIHPTVIPRDAAIFASTIDGALMLDCEGLCHAIGVILDGVADSDIGSSTRGARYNSIDRYVRMRRKDDQKCAALVISEDGPISFFPAKVDSDVVESSSLIKNV